MFGLLQRRREFLFVDLSGEIHRVDEWVFPFITLQSSFNDAFIISKEIKDELIAADPKSAEIIRPILRGRDIKRYTYTFADLWLISTFPSRSYNIDDYPAVKEHLLSFGKERLEQTGRKHIVKPTLCTSVKDRWMYCCGRTIHYWHKFANIR